MAFETDAPMHPEPIVQLLLLLIVANGTPVLARKLLGEVLAYPLDGGKTFLDGRPIFGSSKTIRGIATSVVATTASASLLGLTFTTGLLIAAMSMGGDLVSSFLKRRLGYLSSSRALGLDQIPEALFPAVVCKDLLGLSMVDVVLVVTLFTLGEILLSRLLFKLHIRERPY